MSSQLSALLAELLHLRCERVWNSIGSVIGIDFGPMRAELDPWNRRRLHGFRCLIVESPWRMESESAVLFDWNVSGGFDGALQHLLAPLVGTSVVSALVTPPAWDLRLGFSNGWRLVVFGDSGGEPDDDAWFMVGWDGLSVSAIPFRESVVPEANG